MPNNTNSCGGAPEMTLSPLQMKLLGVKENDPGFKTTPSKPKDKDFHPYGFNSPLEGSFISPHSKSYVSMSALSFDSTSWVYQSNCVPNSPNAQETEKPKEPIKPNASGTFTDAQLLKDYLKDFEQKDVSGSFNTSGNTTT